MQIHIPKTKLKRCKMLNNQKFNKEKYRNFAAVINLKDSQYFSSWEWKYHLEK